METPPLPSALPSAPLPAPPPPPPPEWKGVVGIQNMGNTCYCNTTLQLLRACPEWTVFCLTESLEERTKHLSPENPNRRILLAYQEILRSLWSAHRPAYVRPIGFLTEVRKAVVGTPYEMFGMAVQNDSHEYLVYLLDHFHEAMRQETSWSAPPVPQGLFPEETMRHLAQNGWNTFLSKNLSPVVSFFFGMMRKTVECHTCRTRTYRWEVFNTLKVPCEGGSFMEWIRKEATECSEIEGYRCDTCKEKRTASLFSHLWQLPPHLFITLRRFHFNGQKNMTPCPYRGEVMDFSSFFAPESLHDSRNDRYEVRGMSDHHGHLGGGHYTAQFKHPLTGAWWSMDDHTTHPLPAPSFQASNYLFYFRRILPSSPSASPPPTSPPPA